MKKLLLSLLAVVIMCTTLWAAPAYQGKITVTQSDGSTLTVCRHGDENLHYFATTDGVIVVRQADGDFTYAQLGEDFQLTTTGILAHEALQREDGLNLLTISQLNQRLTNLPQRQIALRSAAPQMRVGSTATAPVKALGTPNIPLLLIEYSDVSFVTPNAKEYFDKQCNADNLTGQTCNGKTYWGSAKDYYRQNSGGKFVPHFEVIGPIKLDNTRAYYGKNTSTTNGSDIRCSQMFVDALKKLTAEGYDISIFDEDHDGRIKLVLGIFAGLGENFSDGSAEQSNYIWPNQGGMSYTGSGVTVTSYGCTSELAAYSENLTTDGIGVFMHEFNHALGLPDLYPTSGSDQVRAQCYGMSMWSIMDYGQYYGNTGCKPHAMTAYEREFLGWIQIPVLSEPANVTLNPSHSTLEAYKIVNAANANEYYIVENLQEHAWHSSNLGHGMLVNHIDYASSPWSSNTVNNNKDHQRVTVIPASGVLKSVRQEGTTYADFRAELYPGTTGATELTDTSTPQAAIVYSGSRMHQPITDIQESEDGIITFKFMGGAATGISEMESGKQSFDQLRNQAENGTQEAESRKVVEEGRLVIIRDGNRYDILGRRI